MAITVNLAGVTDFKPLPAAMYTGEISSMILTPASQSNSGNGYFTVEVEITEGEFEGRKVRRMLSLSEKALGYLRAFLKAVGYTNEELANEAFEVDPEAIINRPVVIKVIQKPDQDDEELIRNEIKQFYKPRPKSVDLDPDTGQDVVTSSAYN